MQDAPDLVRDAFLDLLFFAYASNARHTLRTSLQLCTGARISAGISHRLSLMCYTRLDDTVDCSM